LGSLRLRFRAVVSSFFADIFKGNCKHWCTCVQVVGTTIGDLKNRVTRTIWLLAKKESFDINGYKKNNMLNGFDDIDYLQNIKEEL
jgi:3-isopropylmalate/(R)-2-methylmalate dehydratase small subunit